MKLDTQQFLDMVEKAGSLAFVDIEASGLKGDYNNVLVVSIKPYGKPARSYRVVRPGHDRKLLREVVPALESFACWVTYYGKGFDIPMLNTRLLRWEMPPLDPRPHIDMYYALKSKLLTARKSQSHLLSWLGTPEQKMSISATVWSEVQANPRKYLPTLVKRCESDTAGLEDLYRRTRHLIGDIRR